MFDDLGRVRSQITRVVCQIQQFDFDCNLVVTRKVIIRTRAPLRLRLYPRVFCGGAKVKNYCILVNSYAL